MRDIKFRAWNKLAQKIAMIDMLDFMLDSYRAHAGKFSGSGHLADIELMQFTGLRDKNGKDIYEGDIVKIDTGLEALQVSVIEYRSGRIVTKSLSSPKFTDLSMWIAWGDQVEYLEIIGNIYENPELLEQV